MYASGESCTEMDRQGRFSGSVCVWTGCAAPGASPSAAFLYQVSAGFFRELTDIPELELVRGEVKVRLTVPLCRELLQSVPFTVGAEHVTETWLENIFVHLNGILRKKLPLTMEPWKCT